MASDTEHDHPPTLPRPSGYFSSVLGGQQAAARKPVTINVDNPLNTAKAWPAYHIGVDEKKQPEKGAFGVRLAKLDSLNSQSLIASALTPDPRYGPSTLASRRSYEAASKARNAATSSRDSEINPAPKSERIATRGAQVINSKVPSSKNTSSASRSPSHNEAEFSPRQKRQAAVVGEKKRKRKDQEDELSDDNDESVLEGGLAQELDAETVPPVAHKPRAPRRSLRIIKASKSSTVTSSAKPNDESASEISNTVSVRKKKDPGKVVPKNLGEAGEADTMMWRWRHGGRTWKEIYDEWERITGRRPGESTLSVRWITLCDNIMASGGADDMMILKYRETVLQEMDSELWERVAAMIGTNHEATFSANALRKRYNALKQNGFKVGEDFVEEDENEDNEEDCDPPLRTNDKEIRMSLDETRSTVSERTSAATPVSGSDQTSTQTSIEFDQPQGTLVGDAPDKVEAVTTETSERDAVKKIGPPSILVDYESE